ncbi:hypothetical protein I1A62_22480 [Rhodococcus sp. USK10]|uniref:Uncharacterized protein n=1 Tax=Rhodococcus wratislaviensis TaxID=44752 RepID=A0A402CF80_RHOWR|nr:MULTISPECIES: hypothetical protein [Rhodococcus]QYB07048.1 hypothetical protein I1A62_22480 [Rhodococcus sp. USK10]GCE42199.1 hypothetical protein Rhow_006138 [Rhodococcus wratislaviensis]
MLDKLYAAMLTLTGIGFGGYVLLEEATNAVAGERSGGEGCARTGHSASSTPPGMSAEFS